MRSEVRSLAEAVRRSGAREADRRGPGRYEGVVLSTDPLRVDVLGLDEDLSDDDVTIGNALQAVIGDAELQVDDVLVLVETERGDLVAVELLSDTPLAGAIGPTGPAGPTGPTGAAGAAGATGATGAAGAPTTLAGLGIARGSGSAVFTAAQSVTGTITHGLGVTPAVIHMQQKDDQAAVAPIIYQVYAFTSTQCTFRAWSILGLQSVTNNYTWIAIV